MYELQEFSHMHYNKDTRIFMAAKNCQQTQLPVGESDKSQDIPGEAGRVKSERECKGSLSTDIGRHQYKDS